MLNLTDGRFDRNCQGLARRDFLKVGALGFGGAITLADLLAARAKAGANGGDGFTDKSVVFLFLQGGPSHIETFDPKMTAPAEYHAIFGETQTSIPGVTFGAHFEKMAKIAHKMSVLRSYASGNGGHTYQAVASGGNKMKATMGSIYSRVVGTNDNTTGIPKNILVVPEAIDAEMKMKSNFETNALPTLTHPGDLGATYGAFNPKGGGVLKENMQLRLPQERFDDRRYLLSRLDRIRRDTDVSLDSVDKYQQQAFEVITRGVSQAFDLSNEDPATIARYDTSGLFTNSDVQKWFDMRRASNLLGKQMLMARRLCEAGCGFVTVSDCGWDMHSNNNSPKNLGAMEMLGPQVDHAVSAFIEDCEERGLSDKILLVVTGEMGRTPKINKNGGRDHYGNLTPLVFSGGGLPMGKVIGRSDANATQPATERYSPPNMLATIMHTLFDVGRLRLNQAVPRDILDVIGDGTPIKELV
jgi:uncharacterized protein (DUF1501 family)